MLCQEGPSRGSLFLVLYLAILGTPAYAQDLTLTDVVTGDPMSFSGWDEVFPGAFGMRVMLTVFNDTGERVNIDCDPAVTGPRFFRGAEAVDGDYQVTLDASTDCSNPLNRGNSRDLVYWVSVPFGEVHVSGPPPYTPIRVDGVVCAWDDTHTTQYCDNDGAGNRDEWLMFERIGSVLHDEAGSECGSNYGFAVALGNVTDNCANDRIVSDPWFDVGGVEDAGAVFVSWNGGTCWCEPGFSATLTETTPQEDARFGYSVTAGDLLWYVQGVPDGYDEVVVGAPKITFNPPLKAGEVFVFPSNGFTGFGPPVILPDPSSEGGALFGFSLAAGDVNGDGHGDIVVGAFLAKKPPSPDEVGAAYVFLGDSAGAFVLGRKLYSPNPEDGGDFGYSLALADADADGDTDVIVGTPGENSGYGRVYIFDGPSYGLLKQLDDPSPDGTGWFGESVAAGQMTLDSAADLAVGALAWDDLRGPWGLDGKLVIVFDPVRNPQFHDFYDPVWERSGALGTSVAVANLDDDPDGLADVVVGAPDASPGSGGDHVRRGEVFVLVNPGGNPTIDTDVRYFFHPRGIYEPPLEWAYFGHAVAARENEHQEICSAKAEIIVGEPDGGITGCGPSGNPGSVRILRVDE